MGNRFLKGAMVLSISMFLTKFLGILYVIPFQQLVGDQVWRYTNMPIYLILYS